MPSGLLRPKRSTPLLALISDDEPMSDDKGQLGLTLGLLRPEGSTPNMNSIQFEKNAPLEKVKNNNSSGAITLNKEQNKLKRILDLNESEEIDGDLESIDLTLSRPDDRPGQSMNHTPLENS